MADHQSEQEALPHLVPEAEAVVGKNGRVYYRLPKNWKTHPERRKPPRPQVAEGKRKLWADPEWRARQIEKIKNSKRKKGWNTNAGVPPGMRKQQARTFWKQARFEAALTMRKLDKAGVLDDADEQAKEALKTAISVMRGPVPPKEKLAAARLVLDFTKSKPVQKQDITVSTAEAWLEAVVEDNGSSETDANAAESA
jgi:hypothetical protein